MNTESVPGELRAKVAAHAVRKFAAARGALLVLCIGSPLFGQQSGRTLVIVRDDASGRPLQNVEVRGRDEPTQHLTNERGEVLIARSGLDTLHLRIRQIGYRFVNRDVASRGAGADTLVVTLSRVAVALPATVARAASSCGTLADSASSELSILALDQLRLGAEHFEAFKRTYPFRAHLVRRTVTARPDGTAMSIRENPETAPSDQWGDRYEPGRVLQESRWGFSASILFLSVLADSAFWNRHCLVVQRVATMDGHRVLPLEFAPAPDTREPDWAGTAWIDSASSVIRRLEFHLTGLARARNLRRLDGYMTFTNPSPFIAFPDSVVAGWWRSTPPNGLFQTPEVVQLVRVSRIEYLKQEPPPASASEP